MVITNHEPASSNTSHKNSLWSWLKKQTQQNTFTTQHKRHCFVAMLIGWKATKANRNTQHKRHELKQYTHTYAHIYYAYRAASKKGHLHKQSFCTASSHYKTHSTVMATSQPLLRTCFCRNAYITQTYTGRLTSTPHRLKANTFYKIATKHIGNVRAKCNVDAGNSWFIMTRAHWRICHAFSTISTINTRATALVLGREAGTMEQLPAVNHTYNLSNEQAKKRMQHSGRKLEQITHTGICNLIWHTTCSSHE